MTTRAPLNADFFGDTADPKPMTVGPRAAAPAEHGGKVRAITVYLPIPLHSAVGDLTRRRGISTAALVEEAFGAHGANFHELTPSAPPGAMPTRTPQRRRGLGTVQTQLRLTVEQIAWLDTQAKHHGAPSRSALVTAVLAKHLNMT